MEPFDPKDVLYIGDALSRLKSKLDETAAFVQTKVLPGPRGTVMRLLSESNALLKGIQELIERSGMGKRLGFVSDAKGIHPVVLQEPVETSAVLPDGKAEQAPSAL
jgi:hypothetical protein